MAKTSAPAHVVVVTSFHTAVTGSDLSYLAGEVITTDDPVYKKVSKEMPERFTPFVLDHQPDETPKPAKRRPKAKPVTRQATAAEEAGIKATVKAEREAVAEAQPAALTTSSFGSFIVDRSQHG